ncbi:MAG: SDR family oxidoreductase [Flavimaricola sp.]|nr:SDR family oxidoreductase [Flavimaricola sp.]
MTKRVLITAGASGIGRAMADAFVLAGARVWVTDVDAKALANLPEAIRGDMVDVTDEAAMEAFAKRIAGDWGGLDVICANAGIKGPTGRIEEIDLKEWRDCLAVNLDGPFLTVKHFGPMLRQAGQGVVTFTSSTAGMYGFPYRSPYAAAKWGVIGLMKTAAMEFGPFGIRCNAILPGSVEGGRMDAVIAAEARAKGITETAVRTGYASGTALGQMSEAKDIAAVAVFLASDGARMISGQALPVDGFTINPDPQV